MTTTAQYRELAQIAEDALLWTTAAAYWQCAIAAYPRDPKVSDLARRDVAEMAERMRTDLSYANGTEAA